ncbi:MAG: autotransporter-associated beta strand repeat-containing protein [Opitutus sp.]|nr:autotransporter-associated beta strand repeat-containing protein [Opitutus sp.]
MRASRYALLPALIVMLASSVALRAQTTITWGNSGASAWRSTNGWTGNVVPGGTDIAQVGATGVSGNKLGINFTTTPVLNDIQIGAFELTSAYVKADLAIVNSGDRANPSTLTFNGAPVNGTANVILRNASSFNLTIQHDGTHGSSPQPLGVVLGNSTANVVLIDGSGNITISSNISGSSKQLTLDHSAGSSGTGSLTLSGSNSFTGGVKVNAGTLNINSASALGTGTLELVGGTLDNTSGSSITNSNNNAQTWSGNFTFTGTNDLNLGTGAVALSGGNRTVTVNGSTLTVGGAIGDGGNGYSITKSGAGTLALSGNNTYSGGTTISAGTLTAGHDNALGTGSVIVNTGGTLAISDNVTIGNEIQLDGGALQGLGNNSKFSGTLSGSGTLTGPLTLTESAVYQWHPQLRQHLGRERALDRDGHAHDCRWRQDRALVWRWRRRVSGRRRLLGCYADVDHCKQRRIRLDHRQFGRCGGKQQRALERSRKLSGRA